MTVTNPPATTTPAAFKTWAQAVADDVNGLTADMAEAVLKSLFNANSILVADTDDTPAPLTVAASRILGRKATGGIDDMTTAELAALFGTADGTKFLADDGTLKTPAGGGGGVTELAYAEFTSGSSPTATSEATSETLVTAGAAVLDGSTRIQIECFVPYARPANTAAALLNFWIYDGSTSLGRVAAVSTAAASTTYVPVRAVRFLTPSAASHTYSLRVSVSSGTGNVGAGAGGATNDMPGFIRVIEA